MSEDRPQGKYAPPEFSIPKGENVFVHQAFECCPYAGLITSKIHDFVEMNGYKVVDEPSEAAVQIINTCGYNETRSQRAYRAIETVREANPNAAVVVTGCLTKIQPREVKSALQGVDRKAMLGPAQLDHLDVIFDHDLTSFEATPTAFQKDRYHVADPRDGLYTIMVSTGCLGRCRFCAIRRATLRPQSMTLDEVLAKVNDAISQGHRDIFLASQDLSSWGHDLGLSIVDLMRALSQIDDQVLFSGEAFEPTLFFEHIDELVPILQSGKFAWLVFPVQSGSQRILDLMRRTYRIEEVMAGLRRVKEADPSIITCTDIIYGYEDESWDEFLMSVEVARQFDYAKYNNYEPRPGTPPVKMSTEEMVRRRTFVMEELQRQGLEVDVLTAKRITPFTGKREKEIVTVSDDLQRWLADHEARFQRIIERRNGIELDGGYRVRQVRSDVRDLEGLVFTAKDRNDKTLELVLTRAGEPGPRMAASERFQAVVVVGEGQKLDRNEQLAIMAFVKTLGMKMVPSEADAVAEPEVPAAAPAVRRLPVLGVEEASRHPFRPVAEELEAGGIARALADLAGVETAEGRAWRGELLLWWGRFEQATAELEAARAASSELAHPTLALAEAALAQRRWADAMGLLENVDSPEARGLVGEAMRAVGLLHDAREALLAGLEAHPNWVAALVNLALVEAERGRRAHVGRALDRIGRVAPGLLEDASRELGMRPSEKSALGDIVRVLHAVLASMRGNRHPELVTWFTREGKLRARDPSHAAEEVSETAAAPA